MYSVKWSKWLLAGIEALKRLSSLAILCWTFNPNLPNDAAVPVAPPNIHLKTRFSESWSLSTCLEISSIQQAVLNPKVVEESSKKFGSQCIVVAIDAKLSGSKWEVFTHGGRNLP